MKILSSFTHPHIVSDLYEFLPRVEQKIIYFEYPKGCWSPLTLIEGKEILWKSMGTSNCLFELLKSGRRYRVLLANKNVFKRSFIPNAVRIINSATE